MASSSEDVHVPKTLPLVGHSRWTQLEPFLPFCRNTWTTMWRQGRAPAPIRLGERCTVWNNAEIHRWLADPLNYPPKSDEHEAA